MRSLTWPGSTTVFRAVKRKFDEFLSLCRSCTQSLPCHWPDKMALAGEDMSNDRVSGTAKIGTRTSRVVRVLRHSLLPLSSLWTCWMGLTAFWSSDRLIRIIKLYKAIYEARQLQKKKEALCSCRLWAPELTWPWHLCMECLARRLQGKQQWILNSTPGMRMMTTPMMTWRLDNMWRQISSCNSQDLRCKSTSQSSQMFVCVIGVTRVIGVIANAQTSARGARQCETSNRDPTLLAQVQQANRCRLLNMS